MIQQTIVEKKCCHQYLTQIINLMDTDRRINKPKMIPLPAYPILNPIIAQCSMVIAYL